MKKSQRDTYNLTEDIEDLTLFANESFDTQDVDLFEFTSEESSPLTRLKSIILSLDWEINDEILQELSDEVSTLQPMWQGDKVAEVYLQGLAKIGNYIRTKGAYAHPNSIKLLLTFFYNFEKIISSPEITGDQITQLIKGDVRKFKILQYQITQSEQRETGILDESIVLPVENDQELAAVSEDALPTQLLKAAILGLDWEVTDESLLQFNNNLEACHQQLTGQKPALVLLQGLQALGDYIAEERANSHPDAFTLLHSFNEALDQASAEPPLDDSEIQELLVDRINRLNNLKMVIAAPDTGAPMDEEMIAGVVDEISGPASSAQEEEMVAAASDGAAPERAIQEGSVPEQAGDEEEEISLGAEIDSIFNMESMPAMETADEQYPDEILPPDAIHPVDDELADDLIGAQLNAKRGLAPALSDTEESAGFNADDSQQDSATDNDLAQQLDFLFADNKEQEAPFESTESPVPASATERPEEEEGPIAALADVEIALDEDEAAGQNDSKEAALEENVLDLESKLDSFFTDTIEVAESKAGEEEQSLFFEEASPAAALADSDEQGGFSEEDAVAAMNQSPLDEIEQKLDFFFGDELDETAIPAEPDEQAAAEPAEVAPALSNFDEEIEEVAPSVVAATKTEEQGGELSGALDAFFETAEASPEPGEEPPSEPDELTEALEASLEEGEQAEEATFQVDLAALGAMLPAAVRALDREKLQNADAMLVHLQQKSPTGEHKALAQLLQSVVTMLSRLPAKSASNTEKLVNHLYEQLLAEQPDPATLVTAIGRFSSWMQEAASLMPLVPAASGSEADKEQFQYTAKELYFELGQLRQYMNEEFAKVRHHLKHHH